MADLPDLVMFTSTLASIAKTSHHHYCGFYSRAVLPEIHGPVEVNGKTYNVTREPVVDWAYDGIDTIVTVKERLYTDDDLPHGSLIHHNSRLVGAIVRKAVARTVTWMWDGGAENAVPVDRQYYPIQNGFKHLNVHISGHEVLPELKTKPIVYAARQFDSKPALLEYLKNPADETGARMYHQCTNNAQLVVYHKGINIINMHLRTPVCAQVVSGL